jgi:hypothetical protein
MLHKMSFLLLESPVTPFGLDLVGVENPIDKPKSRPASSRSHKRPCR